MSPTLSQSKEPAANSFRRSATAFQRGLLQPSATALAVAVAVAGAVCLMCTSQITEQWMVRHGELLSRQSPDLQLDVTMRALTLKTARDRTPRVILLGQLVPPEDFDEVDCKAVLGPEDASLPRGDLRTPQQTLLESTTLHATIPRDHVGTVVLMLSPVQFAVDTEDYAHLDRQPRLGIRSRVARRELLLAGLEPMPLRSNYFVDNQSFLLSRWPALAANLWQHATGIQPSTGSKRTDDELLWLRSATLSESAEDFNFAILEHLAERLARSRLARSVLVFWMSDSAQDERLFKRLTQLADRHRGIAIQARKSSS